MLLGPGVNTPSQRLVLFIALVERQCRQGLRKLEPQIKRMRWIHVARLGELEQLLHDFKRIDSLKMDIGTHKVDALAIDCNPIVVVLDLLGQSAQGRWARMDAARIAKHH